MIRAGRRSPERQAFERSCPSCDLSLARWMYGLQHDRASCQHGALLDQTGCNMISSAEYGLVEVASEANSRMDIATAWPVTRMRRSVFAFPLQTRLDGSTMLEEHLIGKWSQKSSVCEGRR